MSITFYISYAVLWVLVVLSSAVVLGLVRLVSQLQHANVSANDTTVGLKTGQVAPTFQAPDLSGMPIDSKDFAGRLSALLFVSPNCPSCTASLYEMEALSSKAQGSVTVVCQAGHDDCVRLAATHRLDVRTIADEDEAISRLFGISSFPTAVLINESGHIQSYGHPKREELEEVLEETTKGVAMELRS